LEAEPLELERGAVAGVLVERAPDAFELVSEPLLLPRHVPVVVGGLLPAAPVVIPVREEAVEILGDEGVDAPRGCVPVRLAVGRDRDDVEEEVHSHAVRPAYRRFDRDAPSQTGQSPSMCPWSQTSTSTREKSRSDTTAPSAATSNSALVARPARVMVPGPKRTMRQTCPSPLTSHAPTSSRSLHVFIVT